MSETPVPVTPFPTFPIEGAMRPGYRRIYPDSHGLRFEALIDRIDREGSLDPADWLALVSFQKNGEPLDPESVRTPAQTVELLCEAAFAICHHVQSTMDLLAKLGHHIPPTPQTEVLCRLAREQPRQS